MGRCEGMRPRAPGCALSARCCPPLRSPFEDKVRHKRRVDWAVGIPHDGYDGELEREEKQGESLLPRKSHPCGGLKEEGGGGRVFSKKFDRGATLT